MSIQTMETNRDLYVALGKLVKGRSADSRMLEEYLCALWQLAAEHSNARCIEIGKFFALLCRAFNDAAPAFSESWRSQYDPNDDAEGYKGFERTILRQIVDLREMKENGALANKLRYFGMTSPRGERWYNFDACTFLECAMAGSFGGWRPDDDTGRDFVPGRDAVVTESGSMEARDPAETVAPIFSMPEITWDMFRSFLEFGQRYERNGEVTSTVNLLHHRA